jgi:hypothetical protein
VAPFAVDFRTSSEIIAEQEHLQKQKDKTRAEINRLLARAEELKGMGRGSISESGKSMPKAQQIFDALVDDIEGGVLDRFPLNRKDDSDHAFSLICSKAKELLQGRLQEEMEDALEETSRAFELKAQEGAQADGTPQANGSSLEALSMLGEKIAKSTYLGKEVVDAETMGAVQAKYKEIGMSRRESLKQLLLLALPFV